MLLSSWANRWQIPPQALAELRQVMGAGEPPHQAPASIPPVQSEAALQQLRRMRSAMHGGRLWRNNRGACLDTTGRMIRFGLGNDSDAVDKIFKSSDLIGITPVTCACGKTYGVFTAEEIKRPGWKLLPSDKRGHAQFNFIQLVVSLGGIARFITKEDD